MIVVLLVLAATLLAIQGVRRTAGAGRRRRDAPLPPGPTPIPFLGNVWGVNTDAPYVTYAEWAHTYGDIIHTRLLNHDIIVLNSEQVAIDLLEKRSRIYSDRPVLSTADLFGWEWATSLTRYGERFRLHRKLYHRAFHAEAALAYRQKQLQKAYEMMTRLLDHPERYTDHFDTFSACVIMAITYGYDAKACDGFVDAIKRSADIFLRYATPESAALCKAFPLAKRVPAWFPFMGFKAQASECRKLAHEALHAPYAWVLQKLEAGTAVQSMVRDAITMYHLDMDSRDPELVQVVKEAATSLYAASVETTNSTLLVFVYLMMVHPEVQQRAQLEIDRVVGTSRLPDLEDRAELPYVDAILRETMRWRPVAPIGLPHAATEDDVYEGYSIPQGATVIANLWAISRNRKKYPNPETFIPERFLQSDGSLNDDKVSWAFGFGRRVCAGRHVADVSLWSAMVCILALFRIEKTTGSENVKWATGLTTHPLPFPCKFVPRDVELDPQKLASLIYASRVDL